MTAILDIIKRHGVDFKIAGEHHHATAGWISVDCPFCSPKSGRFRLGINLAHPRAVCWTCGYHPLVGTLASLLGLTYKAARDLLKGLTPARESQSARTQGRLVLPERIGPLLPCHKEYLRSRGFNPGEIVKLWRVQGIGLASRLQWRLFLPAELDGRVVSWTTRSISDDVKLRYISAPVSQESVSLKTILYGEQHCQHAIVVNEGPLDAWAIGPGAVATCGVGYSRAQLLRMVRYPVRVVLFDAEPKAQQRAEQLCADLSVFDGQTFNVELETGKDASRADREEIRDIRKRFLR